MSYDIPARIEREVERYAQDEHLSQMEAVIRLIQTGLEAVRRESAVPGALSEAEWQSLRALPGFAFLEALPDDAADRIEAATEGIRAERLGPRV